MIPIFNSLLISSLSGVAAPALSRILRRLCVIVFAIGAGPSSANVTLCLGFVFVNLLSSSVNNFLKNDRSLFVLCAATCRRLFTSTYT